MYPTRTERRSDRRLPLKRPVRFRLAGRQVDGQLQDISRSGLKVQASDLPPVACTTVLELCLGDDPAAGHPARVRGQVMWTSRNAAGIRFVEPEGDFVEQLDRLLRGYLLLAGPEDVRDFVEQLFEGASFGDAPDKEGHTVLFDLGRIDTESPTEPEGRSRRTKKRDSDNGNGPG
jgi:hypothetical protein